MKSTLLKKKSDIADDRKYHTREDDGKIRKVLKGIEALAHQYLVNVGLSGNDAEDKQGDPDMVAYLFSGKDPKMKPKAYQLQSEVMRFLDRELDSTTKNMFKHQMGGNTIDWIMNAFSKSRKMSFKSKFLRKAVVTPDVVPPAQVSVNPPAISSRTPAVCSFYGGPKWNGKETASSGRKSVPSKFWVFDDTQPTCAHWTLPLGTKVKFQYGDKSIVLMVTDRGPHPRLKRDFDLTASAAGYLGFRDAGLAKVRVEQVSPGTKLGPVSA